MYYNWQYCEDLNCEECVGGLFTSICVRVALWLYFAYSSSLVSAI